MLLVSQKLKKAHKEITGSECKVCEVEGQNKPMTPTTDKFKDELLFQ